MRRPYSRVARKQTIMSIHSHGATGANGKNMKFDPDIHKRRSIRLTDYDYTQAGAYFVTICAWDRECLFGEITDGKMVLNGCGEMAQECWYAIPEHFNDVILDGFIDMPNHLHGIVFICDAVGARHASPTGVWTYSDSRICVRHDIFSEVTFQEVSNGCFTDFFSEQGNQV